MSRLKQNKPIKKAVAYATAFSLYKLNSYRELRLLEVLDERLDELEPLFELDERLDELEPLFELDERLDDEALVLLLDERLEVLVEALVLGFELLVADVELLRDVVLFDLRVLEVPLDEVVPVFDDLELRLTLPELLDELEELVPVVTFDFPLRLFELLLLLPLLPAPELPTLRLLDLLVSIFLPLIGDELLFLFTLKPLPLDGLSPLGLLQLLLFGRS